MQQIGGAASVLPYPGPPHVVERRHRDGSWLPVAVGIRAKSAVDALAKYRACIPRAVWQRVMLRARLQEPGGPSARLRATR